jgi:hypothetical protein
VIRLDYRWGSARKTEHYVWGHVLSADGGLDWLDEAGKRTDTGLATARGRLCRSQGGTDLREPSFEPSNDSLAAVVMLGDEIVAVCEQGVRLVIEENPPQLLLKDKADGRELACAILGVWDATKSAASGPEIAICSSNHSLYLAVRALLVTSEPHLRERLSDLAG